MEETAVLEAENVTPDTLPNHDDEIRVRAFLLFLARDGAGGSAEDDWLRAETEIAALYGDGSK